MILPESEIALQEAGRVISRGGVIGFRTDTLYGLGADPLNSRAVNAVIELKGRPDGKPILVLIGDLARLPALARSESEMFQVISREHWPGPLTVILPACPELPRDLTAGSGTVGVRLPDDAAVLRLLRACGGTLTATSANKSGGTPGRTAQDVERVFGTSLELIVDGGTSPTERPSTVVDLTGDYPLLKREGVIPFKEVEATWRRFLGNSPIGNG